MKRDREGERRRERERERDSLCEKQIKILILEFFLNETLKDSAKLGKI